MTTRGTQLDDILEHCLERPAHGASIEACLEEFPQHAAELRPLLIAAAQLRTAFARTSAAESRAAILARVLQEHRPRKRWPVRVPVLGGSWTVWASAASAFLIVFLTGFGVIRASGGAVPGDSLYPIKSGMERARLSWPFQSDRVLADLNAELAYRRTEEAASLAQQGKADALPVLADRIVAHVAKAALLSTGGSVSVAGPGPVAPAEPLPPSRQEELRAIKGRMERDFELGLIRLDEVARDASPDLLPELEEVTRRFIAEYREAFRALDMALGLPPPPPWDRPGQGLGPLANGPGPQQQRPPSGQAPAIGPAVDR